MVCTHTQYNGISITPHLCKQVMTSSIVIIITWTTIITDVQGVSLPEEQWLQQLPHLLVTPVLTQQVSWITISWDVEETYNARCNSLTNPMER